MVNKINFEIVEEDFKLAFDGKTRFNLSFKNKNGNYIEYGYNMTMENCIKSIIYNRLNSKLDVVDMKSFLSAFKEENEKLNKLINV